MDAKHQSLLSIPLTDRKADINLRPLGSPPAPSNGIGAINGLNLSFISIRYKMLIDPKFLPSSNSSDRVAVGPSSYGVRTVRCVKIASNRLIDRRNINMYQQKKKKEKEEEKEKQTKSRKIEPPPVLNRFRK